MENKNKTKAELVRIATKDGLELQGLLFEPKKKTSQALIHVHGWVGNFYENKFIDCIADEAVSNGLGFLTFNNRGAGIVNDFIKKKKSKIEYVRIGGSLEEFSDCILDIGGAIEFLIKRGYKKIILQGHSIGCQKIIFYQHKVKDRRVKGLVLLAPIDDFAFCNFLLKGRYHRALDIAKKMIKDGKGNSQVPDWMAFYPLLSAKMFLNVADPKSLSARIFNYHGELKEISTIDCPTLAVFGSKDKHEQNAEEKLNILKKKIKNCDIKLMKNCEHKFVGFEKQLSKSIINWLKTI